MLDVSSRSTIVLTGGTGSLGSALLPYLIRRFPESNIVLLLRAEGEVQARRRLKSVQEFVGMSDAEAGHAVVVPGDLTKPKFGMADGSYEHLASTTRAVFHLAANVNFDAPYAVSREVNVDATAGVISFCRNAGGAHLYHVSTAFVAGDRRGPLRESELNVGQRFWNAYEQTKCEAEELVRAASPELPVTIFRPSQIIGSSVDGRIGKLFGYYEFAKLWLAGRLRVLAGDPNARPDLVPVDYVCEAMLHLAELPQSIGETYHLAAGVEKSLSIRAIADMGRDEMRRRFGVEPPRTHIVQSEKFEPFLKGEDHKRYRNSALFILLRTYGPYLAYERDFEVARTHALLAAAGIDVPDIAQVLELTTRRLLEGAKSVAHTEVAEA